MLFEIRSGGNGADNRAATWPMVLLTARDIVLAVTLEVVPLLPWMIFAVSTFTPKAFASESASNPAISLSDRVNLFVGTKRIGMNWDEWFLPSTDEIRWTA